MNILTFDIEEWYLEKIFFGNHPEKYGLFDQYLEQILDTLDDVILSNIHGLINCLVKRLRLIPIKR